MNKHKLQQAGPYITLMLMVAVVVVAFAGMLVLGLQLGEWLVELRVPYE